MAMLALLAGVALLLVPYTWTALHTARVVVVGIGFLVELWWVAANKWRWMRHPALGTQTRSTANLDTETEVSK
jgi:hypothetical protein